MKDLFEKMIQDQKKLSELLSKGVDYDSAMKEVYGESELNEVKEIIGKITDDNFEEIAPDIFIEPDKNS